MSRPNRAGRGGKSYCPSRNPGQNDGGSFQGQSGQNSSRNARGRGQQYTSDDKATGQGRGGSYHRNSEPNRGSGSQNYNTRGGGPGENGGRQGSRNQYQHRGHDRTRGETPMFHKSAQNINYDDHRDMHANTSSQPSSDRYSSPRDAHREQRPITRDNRLESDNGSKQNSRYDQHQPDRLDRRDGCRRNSPDPGRNYSPGREYSRTTTSNSRRDRRSPNRMYDRRDESPYRDDLRGYSQDNSSGRTHYGNRNHSPRPDSRHDRHYSPRRYEERRYRSPSPDDRQDRRKDRLHSPDRTRHYRDDKYYSPERYSENRGDRHDLRDNKEHGRHHSPKRYRDVDDRDHIERTEIRKQKDNDGKINVNVYMTTDKSNPVDQGIQRMVMPDLISRPSMLSPIPVIAPPFMNQAQPPPYFVPPFVGTLPSMPCSPAFTANKPQGLDSQSRGYISQTKITNSIPYGSQSRDRHFSTSSSSSIASDTRNTCTKNKTGTVAHNRGGIQRRGGGCRRGKRDSKQAVDTNTSESNISETHDPEYAKNSKKPTLVFLVFKKKFDDEFDYENYLKKRTESLKTNEYSIQKSLKRDNNRVFILSYPSKAAGHKLIKLFRKTNSSSDIEILCYFKEQLPANLSDLQKTQDLQNPKDTTKTKSRRSGTSSTKQEHKSKVKGHKTCLYLSIDDAIKQEDIEGFLKIRMGKGSVYPFELVSSNLNDKGTSTKSILQFPSESIASIVIKSFEDSNIDSQTKIVCSLIPPCDEADSNKDKLSKVLFDIENRSTERLENHQVKTKGIEEDINKLVIKTNVSVAEYSKRIAERRALESKLSELKSQESEYLKVIGGLKNILTDSVQHDNFDKIVAEQCKRFGVECCRLDTALPIYARRSDIVNCVLKNQLTILRGETGSGKSTQVVQYLYEAGLASSKVIVCTQPRKVACTSLAARVAEELVMSVGQGVGYKTGMKSKMSNNTKVLFMTDHSLLNECLTDPLLTKYSVIIIDEAHERSIYTDLLLGIIKKCLPQRKDLKVIISSATIEIKVFADYFKQSQTMEVAGRTFPVDVVYLSDEEQAQSFDNYVEKAATLAIRVHKEEGYGDILVFMTSPLETEKCKEAFEKKLANKTDYKCFPLHGQLNAEEQQLVFKPLNEGQRKIVFATNTAETSITIPGIKYVIDTGLAKEMKFDPKRNINSLNVEVISRSSAEQRKGRAGRTEPGKCYRLYTEHSYTEMRPTNIPEILRVHLGQALLKLFELNINPIECDFVESPSTEALASALRTLMQLKAIESGELTENGRWLAKIPFEPRLSSIVKKGSDNGLLYDALVIATLISTGSSLFYRGGNEAEKNKSDLLKTEFCHFRGDVFTSLEAYKKWLQQPENVKHKWCYDNGINSKVIRGARETVAEVSRIMQKELGVKIEKEFTTGEAAEESLQKIILSSFSNNIGHFMGHRKVGYYIPEIDQQVFMHPSSALRVLNDSSDWVVFCNIIRTSTDFITTITPVKDEWIVELQNNNQLSFDVDEVKNKQIYNIHTECFGPTSFSHFVGPRFTKLRKYEEVLSEKCDSLVMLEGDRDLGEVRFFSSNMSESASDVLKDWVNESRRTVEIRSVEYRLGSKTSKDGGVRIVLGAGGEGKLLLMPNEYRSVFITKPNSETSTKVSIMEKFSQYGEIVDCWEDTKSKQRWGKVTYCSEVSAELAVLKTKSDQDEVAIPEYKQIEKEEYQFKARLSWTRRPSKCMAFVDMNPIYLAEAVRLSCIHILGRRITIGLNNNGESLMLRQLPPCATDIDIRDSLYSALGFATNEEKQHIHRVTVVREKGFTTTNDELESIKQEITQMITKQVHSNDFTVDVLKPKKDADINFIAFAKFYRAENGYDACASIDRRMVIRNQVVSMTPDISSSISVPKVVYETMKSSLDKAINVLKKHLEFRYHAKELVNGRTVFNLYSTKSTDLATCRSVLEGILKGEVIECWRNENYRHLFLKSGRHFIHSVEEKTNTYIQVDERQNTISVFGTTANFTRAQMDIQNYLNEIINGTGKDVDLKATGQPKGLMKFLIIKYGLNMEGLVEETGLKSILLDHKKQLLKLIGDLDSIPRATQAVLDVSNSIPQNKVQVSSDEGLPDCCACFCPIEDLTELYRLEFCGHAYCCDCFGRQITVAIQSKDLPILCSKDHCQKPFVWNDFSNSFKKFKVNPNALIGAAVSKFMMTTGRDSYRHCLTPDCPTIYKVKAEGTQFFCIECGLRICTSCHIEYHDGLSCAMYKSQEMDRSQIDQYLRQHADSTKPCPGCRTPIEKNHGCNHMQCQGCNVHFCWICLESFNTAGSCYDHLGSVHGGIADTDDLLYN